MTKEKELFIQILARLAVIEAKLNDLLKKFGADDEDLWSLSEHIFQTSTKRLQEQNLDEPFEQPELFEPFTPPD